MSNKNNLSGIFEFTENTLISELEYIKDKKKERKENEAKLKEKLKLAAYCPKKPGQSWSYLAKK